MGKLHAWRKAYGAIKDSTNSTKDVDVAIVKATNHVECPPKDRHLRKILVATSAIRLQADVAYCIHSLSIRLAKTHNWTVALKTLMVIHRILREGDPIFREELLYSQQRGHILEMSNFRDDSSPIARDCSDWVRTYALYLEERLECFRILKYDIESKRLPRPAQGEDKVYSRTRDLNSEELLEQLSALQQQLHRLIGCQPEGAALGNCVIQYALALVLKESFKIYCAINDGIITLVDKFFEMPRHEAIKGLDIYKRAGQLAGSLSGFYEVCKGLELARNFQFPVLREPPQSFLVTMEEYTREAPRMVSVPIISLEYPEMLQLTSKHEDGPSPSEETKVPHEEPKPPCSEDVAVSTAEAVGPLPPPTNLDTDDLLGLNVTAPDASVIEESNAMALAIVPSGTTYGSDASQAKAFDPTGWEVALVSTLSSNLSSFQERQLAGGLDSFTLHSLYDDAAYRASQQPAYGALAPNPFEVADPFAIANTIAPPPAVQMAQNQTNPFAPFQPIYPQPQQQQQQQQQQLHLLMSPKNPFGDTGFGELPVNPAAHPQTSNPFGSTGLL